MRCSYIWRVTCQECLCKQKKYENETKIRCIISAQCDNISNSKGMKEICKVPLFELISIQILSLSPKISSLTEKGVAFQFTQEFNSRPSENKLKMIKNAQKDSLQYQCFFFLKFLLHLKKNKLQRCQTLVRIKFLPFTIVKSIEELSTATQIFLLF